MKVLAVAGEGGRVLSVIGIGETLQDDVDLAYTAVDEIIREGSCYVKGIGSRASERRLG